MRYYFYDLYFPTNDLIDIDFVNNILLFTVVIDFTILLFL